MKFRKTALKARHKAQLDQEKQQIEKEIEQSVNELKLQLELNRLKAVEKQVGFVLSRACTIWKHGRRFCSIFPSCLCNHGRHNVLLSVTKYRILWHFTRCGEFSER